MKLIIDISEKMYNFVNTKRPNGYYNNFDEFDCYDVSECIRNGILLPKVHGDLIDRSKLLVELECGIRAGNYEEGYEKYPHINDMDDCYDTVKYADTIIKANY